MQGSLGWIWWERIGTIDEGIQKVYNARLAQSNMFMEGAEQMQEVKLSVKDYVKLIDGGDYD